MRISALSCVSGCKAIETEVNFIVIEVCTSSKIMIECQGTNTLELTPNQLTNLAHLVACMTTKNKEFILKHRGAAAING